LNLVQFKATTNSGKLDATNGGFSSISSYVTKAIKLKQHGIIPSMSRKGVSRQPKLDKLA